MSNLDAYPEGIEPSHLSDLSDLPKLLPGGKNYEDLMNRVYGELFLQASDALGNIATYAILGGKHADPELQRPDLPACAELAKSLPPITLFPNDERKRIVIPRAESITLSLRKPSLPKQEVEGERIPLITKRPVELAEGAAPQDNSTEHVLPWRLIVNLDTAPLHLAYLEYHPDYFYEDKLPTSAMQSLTRYLQIEGRFARQLRGAILPVATLYDLRSVDPDRGTFVANYRYDQVA